MGNYSNNDSGGGGGADYTDHNEKMREKILNEKGVPKKVKQRISEIIDLANEMGLKVNENNPSFTSPTKKNIFGKIVETNTQTATLSLHDPILDKDINFFKETFTSKLVTSMSNEKLNEMITDLREMPLTFEGLKNTKHINITNKLVSGKNTNNLGYFDETRPDSIQLTLRAFDNNRQWNTGLKGTLYHEMTHLYDFNKYGICGNDGLFAQSRGIQPTNYAKTVHTKNGMWVHPEVMSTVVEQVATGRLREDACLSTLGYFNNQAKQGKYYEGDWNFTYNDWANDKEWKPLIEEANHILYG